MRLFISLWISESKIFRSLISFKMQMKLGKVSVKASLTNLSHCDFISFFSFESFVLWICCFKVIKNAHLRNVSDGLF